MKTHPLSTTVVLDRYQDFKAITLGAELGSMQLPENVNEQLDYSYAKYEFTTPSVLDRGIIMDYIKRWYPPVEIVEEDLSIISQACEETLAVNGVRGAYYRVRGFKKAAKNIIGAVEQLQPVPVA